MDIQGLGGMQQIAQKLMGGMGKPPEGISRGAVSNIASSIQNDQGQSLVDIREELQDAVQGALQGYDGSGDIRSAVQDAIHSTLEENGFNPEEVKGAMQDAGMDPHQRLGARGGLAGGLRAGGGFDPASFLQNGRSEQDLVQSFLEQFRAGVNLDLEV